MKHETSQRPCRLSAEVECRDALNELRQLLMTTVEPYVNDGKSSTHVCIAGTHWCVGDADRPGCRTDGSRGHAEVLAGHGDSPSIETDMETPENETVNVSMCRIERRTQDSPYTLEIVMAKPTRRWERVSIEGVDIHIPWNVPVEVLGRTFEFGQLERAGEAIVPDVEGEMAEGAGDGDGSRDRGDDGVDGNGTTSSGHIDSNRVEEALLAIESQRMRYS